MNSNSWFAAGHILLLSTLDGAALNEQLVAVQSTASIFNFAELISAVNCCCRAYNIKN
jgi:hypothetical protein